MKRGFILVEATITYVVLTLALVALLPVFIMSMRSAKGAEQIVAGTQLSTELMEEVCLRKWDQSTPVPAVHIPVPSALGVDTGETVSDKRTFNDIDDFDGWSENPPKDPVMNDMTDFKIYTRTVSVKYVDSSLAVSVSTTDYKQVTVCTKTQKMKPICLNTLLTNR